MMKKKSLFKASFEESLNLEDDGFVKLQDEQHEKISNKVINGSTTFGFKRQTFILALLFPIGFNALLTFGASWLTTYQSQGLPLKPAEHVFLNWQIYWVLLGIWLLFVLIGRLFRQAFIIPYRYHFHLYTYMVIILIEMDLLVAGLILANVASWVILAMITLWIISIIFMIRVELRGMRKILFDEDSQPGKLDRLANMISLYGMGLLGVGIVVSRFIGMIAGTSRNALEDIGMAVVFIVLNFVMPATVIFLGIPYFTQAYYKLKYSEEYRDYEGKSPEEWYGTRYLKRHPMVDEKK